VLVGREGELERLAGGMERGASLVILGEAGIGKTAVLREAASQCGRRVYEGGGLVSLSWHSYLPLSRALRRRLPGGDAPDIAAAVVERIDDGVLLLDDLHWADAATLRVVPLLSGRIRMLVAIRVGDAGADAALLATQKMEVMRLAALPDEAASALLSSIRPELATVDACEVVRLARGNPLLLEELSPDGEASSTLRACLHLRLTRSSRQAREAMALLALLGRPGERWLLGPGAEELLVAGLAIREGDCVAMRHALLAEATIEDLGADERIRLHSRLAAQLPGDGEASRHHAAAGELEPAYEKALRGADAAATPGERARHLGVAADCARGADSDARRIAAAEALIDAGEYAQAKRVLDEVASADRDLGARLHLYRGCACWGLDDEDGARHELEAGLVLVRSGDARTEVRLLVERARIEAMTSNALAVECSQRALERADDPVDRARALGSLAFARYVGGSDALDELRAAVAAAREEGQLALEFEMALHLESAYHAVGDPDACIDLSRAMATRARSLGYRSAEVDFRWSAARAEFMARGAYEQAIEELSRCLGHPALRGLSAPFVAADLALALCDVGRDAEAQRWILSAEEPGSEQNVMIRDFYTGEIEWLLGRPAAAAPILARAVLTALPASKAERAAVLGWARLEIGERPDAPPADATGSLFKGGFEVECEALYALGRREWGVGERIFDEAADRFAGVLLRNELRCRWGAGVACLRRGDVAAARSRLLAVERGCADIGLVALLRRVQLALRDAGVARAAPRTREAGLSGREREVIQLVGAGLTSADIAGRLGVRRSTVNSTVKSAMVKLRARTRAQAAAFAGDNDE
jgi:DNA-binding CsgD family transcriptional regulator/tetratricopeptide (TPR) repeat protein